MAPDVLAHGRVPFALAAAAIAVVAALAAAGAEYRRAVKRAEQLERLATDRRRLLRLVARLLAEPLFPARSDQVSAPPADGAYLFSELDCNLDSVAAGAAELIRRGGTPMRFLIFDVRNEELEKSLGGGYGGGPAMLKKLLEHGVPRSSIEVQPYDHKGLKMIHTLFEAELAVRYAKAQGWKSLLVVAPSFHLPRAAMTTASVALREAPDLRVLPYAGAPLCWEESAVHSQGMVGTRLDFLESEMERIERYTEKGDIAPWDQLEKRFERPIKCV